MDLGVKFLVGGMTGKAAAERFRLDMIDQLERMRDGATRDRDRQKARKDWTRYDAMGHAYHTAAAFLRGVEIID